jgi:hypothetical protein
VEEKPSLAPGRDEGGGVLLLSEERCGRRPGREEGGGGGEDLGGGEGKGSPNGLNKPSLAQSVQQPSKSSST